MAFADIAPIADSLGITQAQADNYFSNIPAAPTPAAPPTITKQKYVAVANKVFDGRKGIEKNGGIRAIAEAAGLLPEQVKQIVREINALKTEYDQANL